MKCEVCGIEYGKGKGFHGVKYKTVHFCSQDCYERFIKMKSAPKPPINFKPEHGSDRRKFTDYIQEWTNDRANWAYIMKQAKDIQDEYELNWKLMYQVLKYCREYEHIEWNMEYGLYQFFPKYIQPMLDFSQKIIEAKSLILEDDEIEYHKKSQQKFIGKVEF